MPRRRQGEVEALGHSEAAAPADPSVRRGPALVVGVVAGIVVTVAVLLAVVQNDDDVRLEWASFDLDAPLWLLLLTAAAVGALVSAVGRWLAHRTSRPRHCLHAVGARHEAPAPDPCGHSLRSGSRSRVGSEARRVAERARESLFLEPTALAIAGVALAVAALALDENLSDDVSLPLSVASTAASARSVLSTVASATMTFAGIAFSVVLLVFQMSSSEYSPRVIHGLLRDGFNKRIIGLVVGTFTYCLVTLRSVHGPVEGGADATIPTVSVSLAVVLGVVAVLAIVGFIDHNAHRMDVSRILEDATSSTRESSRRRWWPEQLVVDPTELRDPTRTTGGNGGNGRTSTQGVTSRTVSARRGGWVQQIDVGGLLRAIPPGATAEARTRPGRYASTGSPLVEVHLAAPSPTGEADTDDDHLDRAVGDAVVIGPSRTITQDPAYGLRQIVDVALRALSPGVNDPTTAQDAIFHLADALQAVVEVDPSPRFFAGDEDRLVVLSHRSDAELVDLAFDELCRAASSLPTVTGYLLAAIDSLLPSTGATSRGLALRRALLDQAEHAVAEAVRAGIAEGDAARLEARLSAMGLAMIPPGPAPRAARRRDPDRDDGSRRATGRPHLGLRVRSALALGRRRARPVGGALGRRLPARPRPAGRGAPGPGDGSGLRQRPCGEEHAAHHRSRPQRGARLARHQLGVGRH